MNRSRVHSVLLALTAIVLSAGSVANASLITILPSGLPSGVPSKSSDGQTIGESTRRQIRVKDRLCETSRHDATRNQDADQNVQTSNLAIIDFDLVESSASDALDRVCIQARILTSSQRLDKLTNLPPPVR